MLPPIVMADFAFQEGVLLRDLSEGGVGAHALVSPAVGTNTTCKFELPDYGRVEAVGTVAWSDNSGRFGLRFDLLDDTVRPRLQRWVASNPQPSSDYAAPASPSVAVASAGEDLSLLREQLEAGKVSGDAAFQLLAESIRAITGATGAAIAIEEEGGIICRASSGAAPDVGAHVDPSAGLSGECVRTADAVRCADTETDPRVDRFVCRKLEIRSVVIVPILCDGKVGGVVEVFSSAPHAFQNNAVRLLRKAAQVLAVISPRVQTGIPAAPVVAASEVPVRSAPAVEPSPVDAATAFDSKPEPTAPVEEPPFVPLLNPLPQAEEKPGSDARADAVLAELRAKKLAELAAQQKATERIAQQRAAQAAAATAAVIGKREVRDVEEQPESDARRQLILRVILVALLIVLAAMAVWRFWPKPAARLNQASPQPVPSTTQAPEQPTATPVSAAAPAPTPVPATPAPRKTAPARIRAEEQLAADQFDDVQIRSLTPSAPQPSQAAANADSVTPPPISVAANSQGTAPVASLLATKVAPPVLAESAPTSTGVTGGKLKHRVEPTYPATARALGLSGAVVLHATVDGSGKVIKVSRVSGNPILAEAAAAAVRRWVYEPFVLNGKPVQTDATITVRFAAP